MGMVCDSYGRVNRHEGLDVIDGSGTAIGGWLRLRITFGIELLMTMPRVE